MVHGLPFRGVGHAVQRKTREWNFGGAPERAGRAALITAKDFRTWFATVTAAVALHEHGSPPPKKTARQVIAQAAARLGNTPTICRTCYIHPEVLSAHEDGELALRLRGNGRKHALSAEEAAVYRFPAGRLS